jgi:hypothetical protein
MQDERLDCTIIQHSLVGDGDSPGHARLPDIPLTDIHLAGLGGALLQVIYLGGDMAAEV